MKLNVNSIKQRLRRLDLYISELEKQQQTAFETFKSDVTGQLAVERAFQAAIEACIDMASHIVSVYELGKAEESRDVFRFLAAAGYLEQDFAASMMAMVSFRNRLVHLYWDIDVERLYRFLREDV
jgi:uncharacterized protein YutE (UPF0331/DUF86 family)